MEEETQEETQDSEQPEAEETVENQTEEETPETPEDEEDDSKELKTLQAQKEHFREKAEKLEAEKKKLQEQVNKVSKGDTQPTFDVEDYIEMSTALTGLDAREQEYLVKQHKNTGESLSSLRESEDFQLWNSAYKTKREQEEKALKPSSTQADAEAPKSFTERVKGASSFDEKVEMLEKAGLWKPPKQSAHKRVKMDR